MIPATPAERLALALAAIRAEAAARPQWPAACSPLGLRHAEDGGTTDYAGLDEWERRECGTCEGTGEGRAGGSCVGCGGKGMRDEV